MGILSSERRYFAISPKAFTADGTSDGIVTISDTCGFKVKRQVRLQSDTIPAHKVLEVKKVLSPTQLVLGPCSSSMDQTEDLSAYLVADNATIEAPVTDRPSIDHQITRRYIYDEEPTMADRNVLVDKYGRYYDQSNPLPIGDAKTPEERIKDALLDAPDLNKDLTWTTIECMRRVTEIVYTSASVDAACGKTVVLTRTFTYDAGDPPMPTDIDDVLVIS